MRARYSAYALAQGRAPAAPAIVDYLRKTWHPSTAPSDLDLKPLQWTGLDVLDSAASSDAGTVEFVAHYKVNGRAQTLHEVSRFVREDTAWRYVDGKVAGRPTPGPQGG